MSIMELLRWHAVAVARDTIAREQMQQRA
jgi:hypothetical protein